MIVDIGIKEEARLRIAGELARRLADSYTLYLKTHNFHWNVTGPMFQPLQVHEKTAWMLRSFLQLPGTRRESERPGARASGRLQSTAGSYSSNSSRGLKMRSV